VIVGDDSWANPGAGYQENAAMRVDVIYAALGIVFCHEYGRVFPD
jgi:hypothetical protein